MSGINNVLRGSSCFGKMGVPFSTMLHFVSNILFPNGALLLALNWLIQWSIVKVWNHKAAKLLASHPSTKPISAQARVTVCTVRWQPGLKHLQLNEHTACLLSVLSLPAFFCLTFLLSLSACFCVYERKKHMFTSEGRHIKHKLFFVKGWALFQEQSETLSQQQRAIRALAQTQVCTEYIWSVNICIQCINGLDRPLITDLNWFGVHVSHWKLCLACKVFASVV